MTGEKQDVLYTTITDYVAFVGYTILVWDHIITFGDEVRLIWLRKEKSLMTYLFFLNRYFTPLAFIGNLTAYFGDWSPEKPKTTGQNLMRSLDRCKHFSRYEGSCTIIALELTALLMLFRVWALYTGRRFGKYIIGSVIVLLAGETATFAWLMTHAMPVSHTSTTVKACTMIFDPNLHVAPSLSAWFPLLYDTYVIALTLYACKPRSKDGIFRSHVMTALIKGGLLYYSVIFCVNFVLAIMILAAQPALKNIAAQLEQLLTVAMISRITLGLMREGQQQHDYGFDTCDDNSRFYDFHCASPALDAPHSPGARGSSTMLQHISVMSRISERSSGTGPRSPRALKAGGGYAGHHVSDVPPVTFGVDKPGKRRFSRVAGGRRFGGSFGTVSTDFGTVSLGSISAGYCSAGVHDISFDAEALVSPEISADAAGLTVPSSASLGLSVPATAVISDPTWLTEQEAYELRTLRASPVLPTSSGVLQL